MSVERAPRPAPDAGRSIALGVVILLTAFLLWNLRSILVVVAFAVLLAYALDPIVSRVERVRLPRGRKISRGVAAALVIVTLVALLVIAIVVAAPRVMEQTVSLARNMPATFDRTMDELRAWARANGLGSARTTPVDQLETQIRASLPNLGASIVGWAGKMFANVFQMLGILVLPLLAYYLLAQPQDVRKSVLQLIPVEVHPRIQNVTHAVDRALASYVRGQAVVCLFMGAATGGVLSALNYPHALLLSLIAGVAEVVPVVGFGIVVTSIALDGMTLGPRATLFGIAAYAAVNTINSMFVTPRVMNRYLKIHPFVVIVSVLAGAELLGPPGVLLALPAAAVFQSLVEEFTPRRIEPPTTRLETTDLTS